MSQEEIQHIPYYHIVGGETWYTSIQRSQFWGAFQVGSGMMTGMLLPLIVISGIKYAFKSK